MLFDFSRLPNELIIAIFERLDALSLLAVSATCRLWQDLAKSPSLMYIVMCYRYGVVDGPRDDVKWPVHKRIDALASYYARWNSLRWYKSYRFTKEPSNLYELFSGVYAQGIIEKGIIEFRKSMCVTTAEAETRWEIDTGLEIRDFGMDYFQDLLIAVKCQPAVMTHREVHLRTMSTGGQHPKAQQPIVRIASASGSTGGDSCWIQVANRYIGILFYNAVRQGDLEESNDLAIFDWMTGSVVFTLDSTPQFIIDCFVFLSESHILVILRGLVHPGERDQSEKAYLEVYDIANPGSQSCKRFLLPPINPNVVAWSTNICCDPVPTPNAHNSRPFYTSMDQRICLVTIRFLYEIAGMIVEEQTPFNLIFFTSTLLKDYPRLDSEEEDREVQDGVQTIPWSQWGEFTRVTLWVPPAQGFIICVNGTRIVRRVPGNAPNHYKIQICDFNKYALANQEIKSGSSSNLPVSTKRYVHPTQDNLLKNTLLFKDALYTCLPYLEITTRSSFRLNSVMIDHDNIYLVRGNEVEVLAF